MKEFEATTIFLILTPSTIHQAALCEKRLKMNHETDKYNSCIVNLYA